MHELSVCMELLAQVQRIARERNATSVASITLKIGPLSGIDTGSLRNAYPLAAAGTLAENATLNIEEADVVVSCSGCGRESSAAPNRLLCGHCGDFHTSVVSGDDMILQSLELDGC